MIATHDGTGVILVVESVMMDYVTGRTQAISNVYTAGPRHLLFSLSLPQAYKSLNGNTIDFARIEGLPVSTEAPFTGNPLSLLTNL